MENLICYVEQCKYNHAKGCSAKSITVGSDKPGTNCCTSKDTACEKFELR